MEERNHDLEQMCYSYVIWASSTKWKFLNHSGPKLHLWGSVVCFVFLTIIFLPTATSSPLQASGEKAIVNSSQWEILQGKFLRAGCESTFCPGYRGRPAERSHLLHSPASVLLHSFKTTFPWGPKERYSQPLEGDCGMFVIVFQPLSWVLAHNLDA